MTEERTFETCRIEWQGVTIEISYEADWLGLGSSRSSFTYSHLELQVVEPKDAHLPVTNTGYRSHFLPQGVVEASGGPAAFVTAWLDNEAKSPHWRRNGNAWRQLSLFSKARDARAGLESTAPSNTSLH